MTESISGTISLPNYSNRNQSTKHLRLRLRANSAVSRNHCSDPTTTVSRLLYPAEGRRNQIAVGPNFSGNRPSPLVCMFMSDPGPLVRADFCSRSTATFIFPCRRDGVLVAEHEPLVMRKRHRFGIQTGLNFAARGEARTDVRASPDMFWMMIVTESMPVIWLRRGASLLIEDDSADSSRHVPQLLVVISA